MQKELLEETERSLARNEEILGVYFLCKNVHSVDEMIISTIYLLHKFLPCLRALGSRKKVSALTVQIKGTVTRI